MPQATPSARKANALYSSSPSDVLTAPFTGDLCHVHGLNALTHTHTHTLLSEQPKDLGSGCLLLGGVSTLTT